jgi:hypothetical protein
VYVCVRLHACLRVCVCACTCVCGCACVFECVYVCVCVCSCVCVRVIWGGKGLRVRQCKMPLASPFLEPANSGYTVSVISFFCLTHPKEFWARYAFHRVRADGW